MLFADRSFCPCLEAEGISKEGSCVRTHAEFGLRGLVHTGCDVNGMNGVLEQGNGRCLAASARVVS